MNRLLYVRVGKDPQVVDLPKITLKSLQQMVGGPIETVPVNPYWGSISRNAIYIVNEEGKVLGLPVNTAIMNGRDVICGDFVVAATDGEDIVGLDDLQVAYLPDIFGRSPDRRLP